MKKFISLLLALIMTFSLCTVAFAAEETTGADETTTAAADNGEEEAGDFDWLLDLPFWTVKGGLKVAKIFLKLAIVVVKVGSIFGLVDTDDIIGQIMDLIESSQNAEQETTAPATTVPATTVA